MNEMDTSQMARQAATELVEIGWKQKAMAECYVHSPLPSLVRPFRDRYQLHSKQRRPPGLDPKKNRAERTNSLLSPGE